MSGNATRIVGIDLGTTHTVVAYADIADATARVLPIAQLVSAGEIAEESLLPSALYAPLPNESANDLWGDAPWMLGKYARERGQQVPSRLVTSAKSWLSHDGIDRRAPILPWHAVEGPDLPRVSPVDASFRILHHVRAAYDAAFPRARLADQHVVLTVPASFDQVARELTVEAARRASLSVRLLEEPQAAFYDFMTHGGEATLRSLVDERLPAALVLVCDVGGGTTDLTLIQVELVKDGALRLERVAVGRHLLLGGDNMDLALAHAVEARLVSAPARLDPVRFAELVLSCRNAKERLLDDEPPDSVPIRILSTGSALVGSTLSTDLTRSEVERIVLDGFFPAITRDEAAQRSRTALVGFGLPYERDAAITRHVSAFLKRHTSASSSQTIALLMNGGVFRARRIAERLSNVIGSWFSDSPRILPPTDPDLAVARGAVAYGLALQGHGLRIEGGAPRGYYVGLDPDGAGRRRALCVVPRGAKEGERHHAGQRLALVVGAPVRFDLYASDTALHAPGSVVEIDQGDFDTLPAITAELDAGDHNRTTVDVAIEGELTPIGTLDLACVELADGSAEPTAAPRRHRLAFDLRARRETSESQRPSRRPGAQRLDEARNTVLRVYGKGRSDAGPRDAKNLLRELERLLGERAEWSLEVNRSLFDTLAPEAKARRRSPDHERVFWMFAGFCLRPGYGYPLDDRRVGKIAHLFQEAVAFKDETRVWQQFWIAWRRVAGGLAEKTQTQIRDAVDPFLAPEDVQRKKPKNLRPLALDEMLAMVSVLERVPVERRAELGRWILERTWTDRDPRLWAALGRIGARVPTYASVHHVIPASTVERWLDHLLREKWNEMPSATRAAVSMARVTGDRLRDVSAEMRAEIAKRLETAGADPEWIRAVSELVPLADRDRAEFFGEGLPVGLRLMETNSE